MEIHIFQNVWKTCYIIKSQTITLTLYIFFFFLIQLNFSHHCAAWHWFCRSRQELLSKLLSSVLVLNSNNGSTINVTTVSVNLSANDWRPALRQWGYSNASLGSDLMLFDVVSRNTCCLVRKRILASSHTNQIIVQDEFVTLSHLAIHSKAMCLHLQGYKLPFIF